MASTRGGEAGQGASSAGSGATSTTTTTGSSTAGGGGQLNSMENIKVAVRLRPFTEKERQRGCKRCVEIEQNTVALYSPKATAGDERVKKFTFDHSYWSHDGFKRSSDGLNVPDASHPNGVKYVGQARLFEDLGKFLLENALKGYNSALLAYGQTGSGKSYTVSGYGKNEGILPRFARELFAQLDAQLEARRQQRADDSQAGAAGGCLGLEESPAGEEASAASKEVEDSTAEKAKQQESEEAKSGEEPLEGERYEVYFSMLEIYNEVVRDLLAKAGGYSQSQAAPLAGPAGALARRGLRVREHPKRGFFVENLTAIVCANKEEIGRLIEEGQLNKSIAATSMNETSSRGHTIYEFHIKQFRRVEGVCLKETGALGARRRRPETLTTSVVQLVDLAGSERMAVHAAPLLNGTPMAAGNADSSSGGGGSFRSSSPAMARDDPSQAAVRPSTRRLGAPGKPPAAPSRPPATSASSSGSTTLRRPINRDAGSSSAHGGANGNNGGGGGSGGGQMHLNAPGNHHQQRFKESVSINQSLSALGNCIQVLSQFSQQQQAAAASSSTAAAAGGSSQPKLPYRDSVLTKLLNRCCLSGNSKVALIATLSPAEINYDDTLSTLRFADRAKQIRTHATINKLSPGETAAANAALQRENERLKSILDGRVTRSDDSSQTSNFDDTENMLDNFNGPRARPAAAGGKSAGSGAGAGAGSRPGGARATRPAANATAAGRKPAAAAEGRQGARAPRAGGQAGAGSSLRGKRSLSKSTTRLPPSSEQMQQLVRPAGAKAPQAANLDDGGPARMRKSRSLGQGLAGGKRALGGEDEELELVSGLLDDIELNDELIASLEDENLLSPDSDDSFGLAPGDEKLTNEEKISILNKLLASGGGGGGAKISSQQRAKNLATAAAATRPRKAGAAKQQAAREAAAGAPTPTSRVTAVSSSEKRTNPYLSNLNADEQLTGMLSYLIRPGEMIVGKNPTKCDLLVHGPELRGKHAKLTRVDHFDEPDSSTTKGADDGGRPNRISCDVFIEPILKESQGGGGGERAPLEGQQAAARKPQQKVALFVNGEPVLERTKLNHCDRLLFGSNAYFVFVDNTSKRPQLERAPHNSTATNSSSGDTLVDSDLDLVTYDMAHNEVLRKIMSDERNEAMIRQINDYTHRPGTGKHRRPAAGVEGAAEAGADSGAGQQAASPADGGDGQTSAESGNFRLSRVHNSRLTRSMTVHDADEPLAKASAAAAAVIATTTTSLERRQSQEEERGGGDDVEAAAATRHTLAKIKEEAEGPDSAQAGARRAGQQRAEAEADAAADESYRERLMEDTYEFAMPVAEASAIAKEMGIKVTYGLKILTGEEQLLGEDEDGELPQQPAEVVSNEDAQQATVVVVSRRDAIKPDSLDVAPQLYVHVHLEELKLDFYWSKEKFQERRIKMLELYGAWDVGGKPGLVEYLIEQSKYQGYYVIDPFIDDLQSALVLVGHAQVALRPVVLMRALNESFDVLDVNDDLVGSVHVEALACHPNEQTATAADTNQQQQPFKVLSERELAAAADEHNPAELLNRKFVFLFKVVACSNIAERFSRVMCQYTLNRHQSIVRTGLVANYRDFDEEETTTAAPDALVKEASRGDEDEPARPAAQANGAPGYLGQSAGNQRLVFNHWHFVVIERLDQDVLDFLQHGFLTIQVVGQYKLAAAPGQAANSAAAAGKQPNASSASSTASSSYLQPTLISTIINSINKYRFRIEQQGGNAPNGLIQQQQHQQAGANYVGNSVYANSLSDSAKSNRVTSSGIMNSNSAASSITSASASATINLFDQQQDDDEGAGSLNGISQENIIDMILTKRKLDRAENQLHYLKRTINIAEHYNKKHIPIKTVKKLLSSYGHELEGGSLEEMAADVTAEGKSGASNKQSGCVIQ